MARRLHQLGYSMTAKTNAERQREWRERLKAQGYALVPIACHPEDRERLQRYAERLRKQREKQS